jgi:hypothetical protein
MHQVRDDPAIPVDRKSSQEWAKLLRKLRWIGMEGEARRLELALSTLPPEDRAVATEPHGTD